jgi:poly(A) polymerase
VSDPIVVPREAHPISRRDIDPDALRVLYRLQQHDHVAYLVGGSVRDLLLGRRPKDFDIGTDAHPYQIKRLFRNCWIIGRRFRLAHIKFGLKTIEVATFRKNVSELPAGPPEAPEPGTADSESALVASAAPPDAVEQIHRDNTYGTTEEDAFRRDFTVNALFYDPATRSIIDYVGGLADIERRVIRSIGDPRVRFVEDPVRMLRAAVLGARLGFDLDELVLGAIDELRHLIAKASPARLLEEYFKILRSGSAEESFRALARVRLLGLMTPELGSPSERVWDSLARLDRYRRRFPAPPADLTTPVLIGALLHPIGALTRGVPDRGTADEGEHPERVSFGVLPVARKDLDRLRQLLQILPRLTDPVLPPRVARGLPHRPGFADAVTWLEVFGDDPAAVEPWKVLRAANPPRAHGHGRPHGHGRAHGHGRDPNRPAGTPDQPLAHTAHPTHTGGGDGADGAPRRRRRRRRRGRRRGNVSTGGGG